MKTTLLWPVLAGIYLLPTASEAHNDSLRRERKTYRASRTRATDLLHTRLDVSFDWQRSQLNGKAAITARPHFHSSSTLTLDARGMEIRSLEVYDLGAGKGDLVPAGEVMNAKKLPATYKYENDSIKIDLGKTFSSKEKYQVRISYVAKPEELGKGGSQAITADKGLYFINPLGKEKNKMPQIWTQGETQASSAWFPTIDSPNEKMTHDLFMTVDAKHTTLSNGRLVSSRKNTDGTRTDHWKMDLPHSPYLVMMGVGEFVKVTDAPWNGKEVSYYVEKEYAPFAKQIFGNTREMMDYYSKVLGTPYPWQKYAQIVVRDYVSGAMENTSATLHGDFMVYQTDREMVDGKKGEAVIAHELFHQWFGDLVTAESWSNLPLNESFATYGEYLWEEHKNGRDAADAHAYKSRIGYFQQAEKQVEMIRYHYHSQEDMFDVFSYNKGGQILHMLRKYTGDAAFFSSLRLYLERNRFKNAEIHDLRLAFEEITGEDLNWFFDQWFLSKGHPELSISKEYDETAKQVKLHIKQKQDLSQAPLYKLPVAIDVYHSGKKERHNVTITEADQLITLPAPSVPDLVNFDAERQLLATRSYTKSTAELIFQYGNAPLFGDRLEALTQLKGLATEPGVLEVLLHAMRSDPWFELRGAALSYLKPVAQQSETAIKPDVIHLALHDASTNVRALAIDFLSSNYADTTLQKIYANGLKERSYKIVAASLKALNNTNGRAALAAARELRSEKNADVFQAVAHVLGKNGSDADYPYFESKKEDFTGFSAITYIHALSWFLDNCKEPETFAKAAAVHEEFIKGENEYVRSVARSSLNDKIIQKVKTRVAQYKDSDPDRSAAFASLAADLDKLARDLQ